MPLIKCPDCANEISTAAANCLKCGRPMTAMGGKAVQVQRKGGKFEAIGFLLILAGTIACFIGSPSVGVPLIAIGFIIFLVGRFM